MRKSQLIVSIFIVFCFFCVNSVFAGPVEINNDGSVTVDCTVPNTNCEPYTINMFWGSVNGFLIKTPSAVSYSEYISWAKKYRKRVPGKKVPSYTDTDKPPIIFEGTTITVNQDYLTSFSSFGRTRLQMFAEVRDTKGNIILRGMSEEQYGQLLDDYTNWILGR